MNTEKIVKGVVLWHVNIMLVCNMMGTLLVRVFQFSLSIYLAFI